MTFRIFPTTPFVAITCLVFSGCESASDFTRAVRGRLVEREAPRVRTYAVDPRAAYEALRAASAQMGYRFLRGGPAQGEFEAISGVGQGENHGSARQIALKVGLHSSLDGKGTEIAIRFTEIVEPDSSNRAGQATEMPLRDTPQYEVLFARIGKLLGVPASGESAR